MTSKMTSSPGFPTLSILESEKLKRTGFLPAFLGGGMLAGLVPIANMAVRAKIYTSQPGSAFGILMDADWQLMAQLNILLLVCGACILYHTEYADNGIQKAQTLPLRPFSLFAGKLWLLLLSCLLPLCVETASLAFCIMHWFPEHTGEGGMLLKGMAFELALLLPTAAAMLVISSFCRNMWVSLGIGVIMVFSASMLPSDFPAMTMAAIPFAAPYRMLHRFLPGQAARVLCICLAEVLLFSLAELLYLKFKERN